MNNEGGFFAVAKNLFFLLVRPAWAHIEDDCVNLHNLPSLFIVHY